MKPRTILERHVFEVSQSLERISDDKKDWAFKTCMDHKGFATKSRVICMDCGETFSPDLIKRKRADCPNCKTKLRIEHTRKITDTQTNFFSTAEIHGEFQVVRNYQITCRFKKGKPVFVNIFEILQYWINDNEKLTLCGHLHTNFDSWGGDWSIRKPSRTYYNGFKYKIYPFKYHPSSKFKKQYRKHGIDHRLDGLYIIDAIRMVPSIPQAETLLKARQYSLLYRMRDKPQNIYQRWASIKICMRNRYQVKDGSTWMDYLDLLEFFGMDLRNSKYVCPKDLKKQHDRLVVKKQMVIAKRKIKDQRKRVKVAQKKYANHINRFLGLNFTDGKITVKALETVSEFMEEGDNLKHCVFVNEYYSKEDSLILSARINDKPIETIEISLKSLKVIQARGHRNHPTDYHDQIVSLVKRNMNQISNRLNVYEPGMKLRQLEYEQAI